MNWWPDQGVFPTFVMCAVCKVAKIDGGDKVLHEGICLFHMFINSCTT